MYASWLLKKIIRKQNTKLNLEQINFKIGIQCFDFYKILDKNMSSYLHIRH